MPPKKKQKTAEKGGRSGSINYTHLEDTLICKAWVNVSQDAIKSNGQRGKTFWQRIHDKYKVLVDENKDQLEHWIATNDYRSIKSIQDRFDRQIKKTVRKFNPYYKRAEDNRVSGSNDKDVLEAAMEEYRETIGATFQFSHCLEILWNSPSFHYLTFKNKAIHAEDVIDIEDDDDDDEDGAVEILEDTPAKR